MGLLRLGKTVGRAAAKFPKLNDGPKRAVGYPVQCAEAAVRKTVGRAKVDTTPTQEVSLDPQS